MAAIHFSLGLTPSQRLLIGLLTFNLSFSEIKSFKELSTATNILIVHNLFSELHFTTS